MTTEVGTRKPVSRGGMRLEVASLPRFRVGDPPVTDSLDELFGQDHAKTRAYEALRKSLLEEVDVSAAAWSRYRSKAALLRAYDAASETLRRTVEATERLFHVMLDATFQFKGFFGMWDVRAQARRRMRELLDEYYSFRFARPSSIKALELVERPAGELAEVLRYDLARSAERLLAEMYEMLVHLELRGVVGSIRYAQGEEPYCEYGFFRSVATNHCYYVKQVVREQVGRTLRTTTRTGVAGDVAIQHVWHRYLLSGVCTSGLPACSWVLPLRVGGVVRALPAFLKPHTSIVSGEIESGRIVSRDVARFAWDYCKESVREETVRHRDPGLVLGGCFVLAGWCPKEQPLLVKSWIAADRSARWVARLARLAHQQVSQQLAAWHDEPATGASQRSQPGQVKG